MGVTGVEGEGEGEEVEEEEDLGDGDVGVGDTGVGTTESSADDRFSIALRAASTDSKGVSLNSFRPILRMTDAAS